VSYVRAYNTKFAAGKRYSGDAQVGGMLSASLELYWKHSDSKGVLLVISEKPLGDKKRRQVLRQRGTSASVSANTNNNGEAQ
jgi:hypothetical protein